MKCIQDRHFVSDIVFNSFDSAIPSIFDGLFYASFSL